MPDLKVNAPYEPTGDQPQAIASLADGVLSGLKHQVLLGATGTGKTYTAAKLIEEVQKPTLVMAHNKTLAAQLYQEFKEFFPDNAVEYFVSYYDYFQPEAYLPRSDTYIEKDSSRNDEIDRLRHNATRALFERALTTARRQGARLLELRAATSLARSLQGRGQDADAWARLRSLCDAVPAGVACRDVTEARAVLAAAPADQDRRSGSG